MPLLTATEEQQLLVEWNSAVLTQRRQDAKTERAASSLCAFASLRETLPEIFADQAARTPDAIALTCEETHLTYRELDARATQLATHLRALGVGPEVIVGLCMERSAELIIGLLAILKAGGAYLPLDLAYPAARIAFILKDARAPVLLTQRHLTASLPQNTAHILCIDDLPSDAATLSAPPTTADALAYVIYTSGSTGQPKGCCITHRNVVRLFTSTDAWFRFGPADVWTMFHSIAFDFSVWEIWGALLYGGRVVIVPHRISRSPEQFHELLRRERVTVLNQTPSAFRQLIAADEAAVPLEKLRLVIFGGEALELQSLQPWFDRHGDTQPQLVNMYGITETTVHVTYRPLRASDVSAGSVIGVPIPDLQIYVLDATQRPLPIGVPGELFVGGAGVARGYLRRPELTGQRFIANPFRAGEKLYRTGDLARWLPERDLEYLGRIDQQVKIRGFRIELGEIESVLVQHERVREAVVIARDGGGGEKRLVAYLVPAGEMPAAETLRAHLKAKLPDYMVPATFVALARLPLTNNGKIDTRGLPEPAPARPELASAFAAPRTPPEQALAGIWREVLRLDHVGVHDNFFALGGDSILSIQIITRARQAGLALTPRHLFENQTIAELAAFAAPEPTNDSDQNPVTGPAPLTPIQHWFFERELAEMHHWNQAFIFQTTAPLDGATLALAALAVERHHDALRLRFHRGAAGWEQTFAAPPETVTIARCTLAEAAAVQASMSLADGPLWRLALIGDGRLLIAIHHLAVDGVSWRILLEDLATAYAQLRASQPVQLPAKTTSFQKWAGQLDAYASSTAPNAELAHWLAVTGPALPADFAGENSESSARTITVALDADETGALLHDVPPVYRTQINDVLLTALAQAVGGSVLLDLEGHGREDLGTSADLSRTVGWFTTIFPVSLKTDAAAPGGALKSVKEQLRQIPRRGLGYGALRYLRAASPLAEQPRPDIVFNYLGQFDRVVADSPLFRFADDSPGPWHSPRAARRHALEINCLIVQERLELRWTYSENLHRAETIERLAERYISALCSLIAHCQSAGAGGRTPSDFPLARLDQNAVDRLISADRNVEDILPLAPMQALFFTLGSVQSRPADQWQCRLHGALDVPAFQRAWREVAQRHTILRTAFRADALAEPVQLVHRDVELPWTLADWRSEAAEQPCKLAEFLASDRQRGFDLAQPPLMRFALLRLGESEHHFVWSLPDVLIDGWSWPVVFREVSALYESHRRGLEAALAHSRPYRDYVAWMQRQDFADAEKFWRKNLRGFTEPTPLPVAPTGAGESFAEHRLQLSAGETDALTDCARTHRITPGTLVQAAWALLLARQSGRDDVVFGAAFSGRPTDLAGAESIVGPFVNNLPVRARLDERETVPAFLKRLHAEVFDLSQHQFSPLVRVQGWSEMPWRHRLFDSLLVFQNYLVDDAARRLGSDVEICDFTGPLHTNYALTLLAVPGPELALTLIHRPSQLDAATADQLLADLRATLAALPSAATVAAVIAQLSPPLPAAATPPDLSQNYIAPQTPTEHAIARVWADAFGRARVGTQDNFFDLGGHSLLMLQVHARLRAALHTDLPIVAMFQFPTISALARHLDRPAADAPSFQHLRDRAQQQREALARKRLSMKK